MAERNLAREVSRLLLVGALAIVPTLTGCSNDVDASTGVDAAANRPPATVPHRAIEKPGAVGVAGTTILGRNGRTYAGGPVDLDETALLACAKAQMAQVELREGSKAIASDQLLLAQMRAKASAVPPVAAAAAGLGKAATASLDAATPVVDAFVALCRSKGFEA